MRHSITEEIRKEEEAAINMFLRSAWTSGALLAGVAVVLLVGLAFYLMG
jgi:hypothetical protein